jgi:hypothetical protein
MTMRLARSDDRCDLRPPRRPIESHQHRVILYFLRVIMDLRFKPNSYSRFHTRIRGNVLTRAPNIEWNLKSRDSLELASNLSFNQETFLSPSGAKDFFSRTELLCRSALDCSLVCQRAGPCHGRSIFLGDDLAVGGNPRERPAHGQSAMVAQLHQRR